MKHKVILKWKTRIFHFENMEMFNLEHFETPFSEYISTWELRQTQACITKSFGFNEKAFFVQKRFIKNPAHSRDMHFSSLFLAGIRTRSTQITIVLIHRSHTFYEGEWSPLSTFFPVVAWLNTPVKVFCSPQLPTATAGETAGMSGTALLLVAA